MTDNINQSNIQFPTKTNGEIITIEDSEDLISIAQRRVELVEKLMSTALKITTYRDWVNQNGNPYLVHSGAEKVARLFGIRLSDIQTTKIWTDDSKGKYYIYKTTGTVSLPGKFDSIEALGTCSQRDKFFAFANNAWKDTLEIDETNVMKASYSNFVVNAITHLLGLRNLTWEQLKEAGIDTAGVQKIEYDSGKQKVDSTLSEDDLAFRKEIWDICLQMTAGDEKEASELLGNLTEFKAKDSGEVIRITNIDKITKPAWIKRLHTKAKKMMEEAGEGV